MRRLTTLVATVCLFFAMSLPTSAGSAVLYEPNSGTVLYEQDGYTTRSMASTTKLMTALLAEESGDWEREIQVTAEMVTVEGSALGLHAGDTITLRDAVCGMLLASGNDAAGAVALTLAKSLPAFAELMNQKAATLGMEHTHFVTPSGLDAEGHCSTAYDMALLGAAVLACPTIAEMCAAKQATIHISGRAVTVTNHNRLLSLYPDAIGLKTGYTKKSGRCLVSAAQREGVTLVAVTLDDGDDWQHHMAMFESGFSMVRAVELPAAVLPAMPVVGGTASQIALQAQAVDPIVLPTGQEGDVVMTLCLPRFVFAPVAAGDKVGEVLYTLNGEELCRLSVTAADAVDARPVAGGYERFCELLLLLWADLVN